MAKHSTPKATRTPAPAPAPVTYQHTAGGATAASLWAWVNANAGGNAANVAIVPLPNCTGPAPLPFAKLAGTGKRANILWALANGTPVAGGNRSNTLQHFVAYSVKHGASGKSVLDLLAALNGGYSAASKHWGTAYIALQVIPAPAPSTPAA